MTAQLAPILHQMQPLRLQSLGASFGKGSWVPNSHGAEPLQWRCSNRLDLEKTLPL